MALEDKNQILNNESIGYLDEQIDLLKERLSLALNIPIEDVKVSFPTLQNFYLVNNIYKSSWAVYVKDGNIPQLLFTGNFLIQGGKYSPRASKSPFGVKALSSLISIANTFSYDASIFKQNWTLDLNIFEEDSKKLRMTVLEYKNFLNLLNSIRAKWLLHLSEEGNFDFVITEFSEPLDALFFMDLENFDSLATKIKTYFKPISQNALDLFQELATNTEFEGKFYNLQPGTWLKDDVLIELEKFHSEKFYNGENVKLQIENIDYGFTNPFKIQIMKPSY